MTMHQDAEGNEPERKAKQPVVSVRVSPCMYEYHDSEDTDVVYLVDCYGRMRVQLRHLASASKSTWN